MLYVEIDKTGTIGNVRTPTRQEIKLSDGARLGRPEEGWTDGQLAACGLFPVVSVPKPVDTATATHARTVELSTPGDPTTATDVWTPVDFTQAELDAATAAVAAETARLDRIARLDELAAGVTLDNAASRTAAVQDLAIALRKLDTPAI